MNTSISPLETKVDSKDHAEETTPSRSSDALELSFSPDSDAIAILRKRRLRRGQAIAATAVSSATSRGHTVTR